MFEGLLNWLLSLLGRTPQQEWRKPEVESRGTEQDFEEELPDDLILPWLGPAAPSMSPDRCVEYILYRIEEEGKVYRGTAERDFLDLIKEAVSESDLDLPPFPEVAMQLDELLRNGEPPISSLVKLVERDPALAREVWKRASSARFARAPSTLSQAIARIGSTDLWRLTMRVCLKSTVFRVPGLEKECREIRNHGIIAAEVAAYIHKEERGPLYMAGLLHDVGKLMVYRCAQGDQLRSPPEPALVIRLAQDLHPTLGVLMGYNWKLNDAVTAGMGFHHSPSSSPQELRSVSSILEAANIATHVVSDPQPAIFAAGREALTKLSIPLDVNATLQRARIFHRELEGEESPAEQSATPRD